MCPVFVRMRQLWPAVTRSSVESTAFTFCDSFSSSSLTASMCDRDLRHSLLKMSFMSGEHSDRTLRHSEMRSTSSSVMGFLGNDDLPRWSTVTMMSMDSATKDWGGRFGDIARKKEKKKDWVTFVILCCVAVATQGELKDNLHFVSFCLEQ